MNRILRLGGAITIFFGMLLPFANVSADVGPKPTMEFRFEQEGGGQVPAIESGILYECDQADCSDAAPLEQLGPQGFSCTANGCHALAYGFSSYHKLEIKFADGTRRTSNIFKTAGFDSVYTVTVRANDLQVKSHFVFSLFDVKTYIIFCSLCLVVLAVITAVIILLVRRRKKKA